MNKKEYHDRVIALRTEAQRLAGFLSINLPDRLDPRSEFARAGGSSLDNSMLKGAADLIWNVMHHFNKLQEAIGLPDGYEPRFLRQYEEVGDPRLRDIRLWVNSLQSHLRETLPDDISGDATGGPLRNIKKCVEEIAGHFNVLQRQLGLRPGEEPRFARVFESKTKE